MIILDLACILPHLENSSGLFDTTILPQVDDEIAEIFKQEFHRHTPIHFNSSLSELQYKDNKFTCTFTGPDGSTHQHQSERVLFAIGRIPNADTLGLENTDIKTDKRGFIVTDDHLRTTAKGIYAAGDIAGKHVLQHAASYDIHYLRQALLKGESDPLHYGAMPYAVFTEPEIASVGLTEEELIEKNTPYVASTQDWKSSARAMASKLDYPRVKLLVCPRGNVDNDFMTAYHSVTPMPLSLNMADMHKPLAHIPQYHFIAEHDKSIPPDIFQHYADTLKDLSCVRSLIVKGTTHSQGWPERWADLLQAIPECDGSS